MKLTDFARGNGNVSSGNETAQNERHFSGGQTAYTSNVRNICIKESERPISTCCLVPSRSRPRVFPNPHLALGKRVELAVIRVLSWLFEHNLKLAMYL